MLNGLLGGSKSNAHDLGREIAALRAELGDVAQRVSRVSHAARGELEGGLSSLGEARQRLSHTAQDLVGRGRNWLAVGEGELRDGMKQARASVARNPMAGIALAAAIGFIIGVATRRD